MSLGNPMKRLFAAAALAPLYLAASAQAQTSVTTATTTPLVTSTAGNVTVTAAGSILVGSGVGVTVDSNSTLDNAGSIIVRDATTATAILVDVPASGRTSTITLTGQVGADDTATATDTDGDGDADGKFAADGTLRYGLRLAGPGVFTGNISQTAGTIGIKGVNGSAAVSVESGLVGNLTLGNVLTVGDNSYGLRVTGPVTGNITLSGGVSAQGKDAVAVSIEGPVTGQLKVDGQISATGFRFTSRFPSTSLRAILDADDLLIGGPAVDIKSSITSGFLLYAPPPNFDTADLDEDDDGIEDSRQTLSGTINQFGSAPALRIGSTSDIALGNVGTGQYGGFGVSLRGLVAANGINDGISATAVQIGGLGGAVTTGGGVNVRGTVSSTAYLANATAIQLGSGVSAPVFLNDGLIQSNTSTDATVAPTVVGLQIDAGASVPSLVNNGSIAVSVAGPAGSATAVLDSSGSLTSIVNNSAISASLQSADPTVTPTGTRNALDLRANTAGVNLVQQTLANRAAPTIQGDILFGTGAGSDNFELSGGLVLGNLSFGGGADVFTQTNGSIYSGRLSKGAGTLAVNINNGLFGLTNTSAVNLTSLNVGPTGVLLFNADPTNADPALRNGRFNVAGAATLQSGSKIGLNFRSKLTGPAVFTVIEAGSLNNQGVDTSLLGQLPFIYKAGLTTTSTTATINVEQRTAAELGLAGGRAAAFDAFYGNIDSEAAVLDAVFTKTDQASFDGFYNQFLPDYSGGVFQSVALGARSVMRAQSEEATDMAPGEPRSWLQEIGSGVKQESATELNYRTTGFGLAGGYEVPIGDGSGAAGISAAYLSSDVRNQDRSIGTSLNVNSVLVGGYWRDRRGALMFDASLNGGYVWIDSTRQVIDQTAAGVRTVQRDALADWSGFVGTGRAGVAYDYKVGAFYVRPDAFVDYVYLREGAYSETGGGAAIDLAVESRSSYQAGAEAGITLGARFGRAFRWGPEIRLGYRTIFAGGLSETTARFVNLPGQPFALSSVEQDDGRVMVQAALRGSGAYSNFALEAGGEIGDLYEAYMARLIVRFLF